MVEPNGRIKIHCALARMTRRVADLNLRILWEHWQDIVLHKVAPSLAIQLQSWWGELHTWRTLQSDES